MPRLVRTLFVLLCFAVFSSGIAAAQSGESAALAEGVVQTEELSRLHERFRVAGLEERAFSQEQLWDALGPIVDGADVLSLEIVGHSAEGRPLHVISYGNGPIEVLLWSQMHGDESTATMALADLFHFLASEPVHPLARRIAERLTLRAVPMLNPDGAARFTRRNAQGIDINRDAVRLATPEARALKALQERFRPAFGFNLHDQDVRTRVGTSHRTAAIALLAPSFNEAQDDNPSRLRAKHLSAVMRRAIEPLVGGHITRYEADFYPRAFGDNMQKWGVSTVLLESGGWKDDPEKQYLRRVNFVALLAAFDAIATGACEDADLSDYLSLPWNGSDLYDLLVLGGHVVAPGVPTYRADLAINYDEPLERSAGHVEEIGHLEGLAAARDTLDGSGLYIHLNEADVRPGMPAHFTIRRSADPLSDLVWTMDGEAPVRRLEGN